MNVVDLLGGLVGAFVPASITAVALALQGGRLGPVTAAIVLTLVVCALGAWRLVGARVVLDAEGVLVWSLLAHGRRVDRKKVAVAIDLPLFNEERMEPSRQLFLMDARGRTLLRMNGAWWSDDQLAAVAQHLEVPLETIPESMTSRELRRTRAVQLQWFERHPVLGFLAAAAAVSAGCAVIGTATTLSLPGH
jgi:hypothetical protein